MGRTLAVAKSFRETPSVVAASSRDVLRESSLLDVMATVCWTPHRSSPECFHSLDLGTFVLERGVGFVRVVAAVA